MSKRCTSNRGNVGATRNYPNSALRQVIHFAGVRRFGEAQATRTGRTGRYGSSRPSEGNEKENAKGRDERTGRFLLQKRDALCLCCLAQIAIKGRQRQFIAAGKLQVCRVVHSEAMLFGQRQNLFAPSGRENERWFGVDRQTPEFFPELLRLFRLDALPADSHQERVCHFGGPVRRNDDSITLP